MTKFLLLTVLLVALSGTLSHANPEESISLPQKRASGVLYKRITEEFYRLKRQSGTINWDLNQMYDLYQKIKGDGRKRSADSDDSDSMGRLKRQSGTMNWDLNQMYDLFSKVKGDMGGGRKRSVDSLKQYTVA